MMIINPYSQLSGIMQARNKYDTRVFENLSFHREGEIKKLVIFNKGYYFRKVKSDRSNGVYIQNHTIYYKNDDGIIYPDLLTDFLSEISELHQLYLRDRKLNRLFRNEIPYN